MLYHVVGSQLAITHRLEYTQVHQRIALPKSFNCGTLAKWLFWDGILIYALATCRWATNKSISRRQRDWIVNRDSDYTFTRTLHLLNLTNLEPFPSSCHFQTELCTLGGVVGVVGSVSRIGGMECLPLRSPPGPYHYHVTDQAKSLQVSAVGSKVTGCTRLTVKFWRLLKSKWRHL